MLAAGEGRGSGGRTIRRGTMRHDVRSVPAFTEGPREFYERSVIEHEASSRVEPEPAPPSCRPRNFVQHLPAFTLQAGVTACRSSSR